MIAWIQNVLERKGRILFILLLAVVIVSFVFVIGETPGCVGTERGAQVRDYYGYNLNSPDETNELVEEVLLSAILSTGQFPRSEQQVEQGFLTRAALLHQADRLGIPPPDDRALRSHLATLPFFRGEDGTFDPARLRQFLDSTGLEARFGEGALDRTLQNDFRIGKVLDAVEEPGLALPPAVEREARLGVTRYDLAIARFPRAGFAPEVDIPEDALEVFFSQRVESYRIPETRLLDLVVFPAGAQREAVGEPTAEELQAYWEAHRSEYQEDPAATAPEETEAADGGEAPAVELDAVRPQVVAAWKEEQAGERARRQAEEMVYQLFDRDIERGGDAVAEAIASFGGETVEVIELVGEESPGRPEIPDAVWAEARRLDELRYFSDPFPYGDGAAVLLLEEIVPSRTPELAEVRAEVEEDFRTAEAEEAFVARGEEIRSELQQAVAAGEDFRTAAEALGLEVETYEGVSRDNLPEALDLSVLPTVAELPDREVSTMSVNQQGGRLLWVASRSAPAVEPGNAAYEQAQARLATASARRFTGSLVSSLVEDGLARAEGQSLTGARP
jgi:peptidyl-prolyl cis-trans isomerase D